MSRCYNFCAGPAALPESVLEIARNDMLEWHGKGLSLMEMSHRSPEVVGVVNHAEQTLRSLLGISEDYAVLFLQGGASTQFGSVPLNLLGDKLSADYVNTGQWSKKAIEEGRRYCEVNVVASSQDTNFSTIPPQAQWQLGNDAAYLHYTPERNHWWCRVFLDTAGGSATSGGHVLYHFVAADTGGRFWRYLCGCPEKYRPFWSHFGYCAS